MDVIVATGRVEGAHPSMLGQVDARILVAGNVVEGRHPGQCGRGNEDHEQHEDGVNLVNSPKVAAEYGVGEQKPISALHGGAVLRGKFVVQ